MIKEKEFFRLAKKMNEQFAIIPLLFGSVALNMLVEDDVYMGDIDIAVPHYMRPDRKWICPDLVKFMENEEYEFTCLHEGEFHKGDIMIHFAGDNGFMEYADIDVTKSPIMQTDGAMYKILTLEQQVNSYTVSAECDFRQRDSDKEWYVNNDLIKANISRKALERSK
ncbi:MAG: hypothetical protein LBD23_06355 [Oscillospiraceae bacterium]|jgi:hypothetical protein|nr:hypothetical protein [Oscillospiraceae bacterium]